MNWKVILNLVALLKSTLREMRMASVSPARSTSTASTIGRMRVEPTCSINTAACWIRSTTSTRAVKARRRSLLFPKKCRRVNKSGKRESRRKNRKTRNRRWRKMRSCLKMKPAKSASRKEKRTPLSTPFSRVSTRFVLGVLQTTRTTKFWVCWLGNQINLSLTVLFRLSAFYLLRKLCEPVQLRHFGMSTLPPARRRHFEDSLSHGVRRVRLLRSKLFP